jgi:hypothetical protein
VIVRVDDVHVVIVEKVPFVSIALVRVEVNDQYAPDAMFRAQKFNRHGDVSDWAKPAS